MPSSSQPPEILASEDPSPSAGLTDTCSVSTELNFYLKVKIFQPGYDNYAYNLSTWETEAEGSPP